MPLFRQLELSFDQTSAVGRDRYEAAVVGQAPPATLARSDCGRALRLPNQITASDALALQCRRGRDHSLEGKADALLRAHGAARIASQIEVEWNPRLRTCAGRADYRRKRISLNPLLHQHGVEEIERTFLHELAHLLAQFRSGRKCILPHGTEWRKACEDLGIADEKRCHTLPFPVRRRNARFLYLCPNCRREFPRVRAIRRAVACLPCCRAYSKGRFDKRFKLKLVHLNEDDAR